MSDNITPVGGRTAKVAEDENTLSHNDSQLKGPEMSDGITNLDNSSGGAALIERADA